MMFEFGYGMLCITCFKFPSGFAWNLATCPSASVTTTAAKTAIRMVCPLERKLYRRLHQPRRRRFHHLPEQWIVDIPVHRRRSEELRVIKRVEAFQAKLNSPRFR